MTAVEINLTNQRATSTTEPFEIMRKYDFMVATTQVNVSGNSLTTSESNQLDLHFHHLLHLVTFKISGLSSTDFDRISQLQLTNIGDNIFSTIGKVDLTNPSFPITPLGGTSNLKLVINNLTIDNATDVIYFNMLMLPLKENDSMSSCTITRCLIAPPGGKMLPIDLFHNKQPLRRAEATVSPARFHLLKTYKTWQNKNLKSGV